MAREEVDPGTKNGEDQVDSKAESIGLLLYGLGLIVMNELVHRIRGERRESKNENEN